MHEFSLAKALWEQVERLRRQHRAGRVLSVRVGVGEMCGVEPDLLGRAFSQITAHGQAGSPALELERVPLEARCEECGSEFGVRNFRFICPRCESPHVTLLRGEHLILQEVTLDSAEDCHD
jgi:hydrogenase nickel incorporation protein HypA/HybF